MQPPQALANGASQGPKHSADEQNNPSAYVFSLTLLPTAKRFSPMTIVGFSDISTNCIMLYIKFVIRFTATQPQFDKIHIAPLSQHIFSTLRRRSL
jgi:hypothetical protein